MIAPSAPTHPCHAATDAVSAADDVYLCRVYEDVVVLDLKADQYLCLVDAGAWLHPEPNGRLVVTGDGSTEDLIAAGIAATQSAPRRRRISKAPTFELPASHETSPIERLWAAVQIIDATRVFRRKTLGQLVAAALKPPMLSGRPTTPERAFRAYTDAVSWIPGEGSVCSGLSYSSAFSPAEESTPTGCSVFAHGRLEPIAGFRSMTRSSAILSPVSATTLP